MKIETTTRQQILRNAFLSLFIYILPITLMFISFVITGKWPWQDKKVKNEKTRSVNVKNTLTNGSND